MSALVGDLQAFALPDVCRLLSQNKQTGGLSIVRNSGDGIIYVRDGEVYFAESSLTKEYLGQRLAKSKLITQGQLLRVLDEQKKRGDVRIGDLLVEKGFLTKELLDTFIKEQIQDSIFNLLQWDIGTFTFDEGVTSDQEVGFSVSVESLIMESSRRLDEWEVIQRKIPSLDVVLQMAMSPPEDVVEINIKPEEWTLLVLADGNRSIRDIAASTENSEFDACRVLYGLVTAGLLEVVGRPIPGSTEEPSHVSPRDVDDMVAVQGESASDVEVEAQGTSIDLAPVSEIRLIPSVKTHTSPDVTETTDPVVEEIVVGKRPEGLKEKDAAVSVQTVPTVSTQTEPISKETLLRLIAGVRSL